MGRLINYLLFPLYVARLAQVADYGQVNVIFSYASFLAVIFTFGMETGFFNFARKTDRPQRVFSTAGMALLVSGLVLVLCGNVFSDGLMNLAGYPGKPEYAVWFTSILAADALTSLGFAWLRFTERPWRFAVIRLTNIFINVGANLFFLIVCPWLASKGVTWVYDIWSPDRAVDYIFLSNLLASLITLPLMAGVWKNFRAGFDGSLFRRMLAYSLPMVLVGMAGMVNETLDRILLKQMLPAAKADYEVGIYGAFYKLSMVMTLFVQAFRFAAEPFFFKQAEEAHAPATYAKIMTWFVYACGFIYVVTMVSLPWLAPLLIQKPAYFADGRGMSIVSVLLLANLLLGVYYNLSIWYKLSDRTMMGAWTALFGAAVTLAGNFIWIGEHSFIASAWTTLAAYGSMVLLGYSLGQRYYPVPYPVLKIAAFIMAGPVLGYLAVSYAGIAPVISLICIPAYLLAVWYAETRGKRRV